MARSPCVKAWIWIIAVICFTTLVGAHPLSTFGVRLNVTGDIVTATINADARPLLLKLDALAATAVTEGDTLQRVGSHNELIQSLSFVEAGGTPVALSPGTARINADGQIEIALVGTLPPGAREVTWRSRLIYGAYPVSTTHGTDTVESVVWLQGGETSQAFPTDSRSTVVAAFTDYAALGFEHILPKGLDHILFVLGLFLLAPRIRPLLAQVSVFTLAHSLSLALAVLGVVSLPPSIVEPLIALSIVYVGVENLFRRNLTPHRLWLVGAWGLLHGLGFAGVLSDLSLPAGQTLPALSGFNVGVEIGQLAVIAIASAVMFAWTRWVADADPWLRRPASAGIAIMGAFWVITRL